MYEFTKGGTWLRWGALDGPSRSLFATSLAASAAATIPLAMLRFSDAYLSRGVDVVPPMQPWMAIWIIAFGTMSALLWWRFSLRQDELFNRIQTWTLGMSGTTFIIALAVWFLLERAGFAPPIADLRAVKLYLVLVLGFWFAAVRRWV